MLINRKFRKFGAYLGILSILSSNVAVAMQPSMKAEAGKIKIYGRNSVQIIGSSSPTAPVNEDVSDITYEDFDVTVPPSPFLAARRSSPDEVRKIRELHLDTNIPYVGGSSPRIDYESLRNIPFFIAISLQDKLHPSRFTGAKLFWERIILPNQQKLSADTQEIPDLDCLFYKPVNGEQHLFLRISSAMRQEGELFKRRSAGKTFFIENPKGELQISSGGNMLLDHVNAEASSIKVEAKDAIENRASQMKAKWLIQMKAGKLRNETLIRKLTHEDGGSHHFTHTESVAGVDECGFVAEKVVLDADEVENIGIFVEADTFEDRATHSSSMPAKITLHNYAWEEDKGMLSSARTSVVRRDDVLVPSRYHVNYYKSISSEPGSSVRFGYTLINAGSKIEVIRDVKEDVVVDEKHTIEIHEEKSGFSICGGARVPDPTDILQKMHYTLSTDNMIGLSTSAISAVAKGIQAATDYEVIGSLLGKKTHWGIADSTALLQTLAHYVNGPSVQFGSRSVDTKQEVTETHGNTFFAPQHVYHNPTFASFAGTYVGKDIDIKTGTMVTFDLPQAVTSKMSVRQSGISMDLLSFAIALMNPEISGALDAGIASSALSVSFQDGETRQVMHKPTVMQAEKLSVEAKEGRLTQAQIKAGIIHAIFSNNLVLKTLANEKWARKRGGSLSFGLSPIMGFENLADVLKQTAASGTVSVIDSGSFEKIIDDFAGMVGEEEFYLKVGGILRTESAFVGHATHEQAKEHIEAKERQDIKVEEHRESWDNSFDLSIGDLVTVTNTLKQKIFDDAIAEGLSPEEATQVTEQEIEEVKKDIVEFQEEAKKVVKTANEAKEEKRDKESREKSSAEGEIQQKVIELLLEKSQTEDSFFDRQIWDCFNEVMFRRAEISPRDQMRAFIPKNKSEEALKSITLLRYKLEDFVAKHPEAAEVCSKAFVGAIYALQGIEYAVAGLTLGPAGILAKFATQESTAWAIDATVDESSNQAARLITQVETLQHEFANTIKFCTYTGLCAGSVKAGKKLISSLSKSTVERAAFKVPLRSDIIKEPEMVQRAATLPGEWKGQFKLINDIAATKTGTEYASSVYSRQVLFKDSKTGQMFRVFQRNDIDPNYVIRTGTTKEVGRTNLELMLEGRAPYTNLGEKVIIHHMGQDAFGPFVEVTKRTHKSLFHNQFGINQPHPTNPVMRTGFDPIREAYWRAYAEQFK